ncbi:MAG: DNA-3-methyladenine glycosylase 2 family protein [Pedobacter sp.]|uniref:DNA-3-methyladenine glycosylase family protein n=1 Tax=Pedobacter sp. TaxID=1411316 RepID=UPI003395F916
MPDQFIRADYHLICDRLAAVDADLANVMAVYGYPPMWTRPNTFESLVHIILEQQVSLASALATLNKLKEKIQQITPANLLMLSDEELRGCYFSRQKTAYVRYLAEAIVSGQIDLAALELSENDVIRKELTSLKGIGNWTVDIYLMFTLQRKDIFPIGDLAAVSALKKVKSLEASVTREAMVSITEQWKPYRTIACMILWHAYLSSRNPKAV